jgi:uncharacterized phage protein (TIGR01671 family)
MRTIKFRPWNKHTLKMNDCFSISDLFGCDDGSIVAADIKSDKPWFECNNDWIGQRCDELYILMQYIGITDVNGKEIYEGDIINGIYTLTAFYGEPVVNQSITYNNGQYEVTTAQNNIVSLAAVKHKEVIGNIYENPELLEGLKNDI